MFISGVMAGDNEGWDVTCHDVGVLDTWEGLEHVMRKSSRGELGLGLGGLGLNLRQCTLVTYYLVMVSTQHKAGRKEFVYCVTIYSFHLKAGIFHLSPQLNINISKSCVI